MVNRLDIALLHRPGEIWRGGFLGLQNQGGRTERFTFDFVVDGTRLYSLVKEGDLSGAFLTKRDKYFRGGAFNRQQEPIFLGAALDAQRLELYICPECGDLGCGAITCDLTRSGDKITWSRFGYENGYDEAMSDFESYADIGPFEFNAAQYAEAIGRAVKGGL